MNISKKKLILAAACAVLLALGCGIGYAATHVFVNGTPYPANAETLDLRDQALSVEEFEAIAEALPNCQITWDVPFQGQTYGQDTLSIAFTQLTQQEADALQYLPCLTEIDATGCRDYAMLENLQAQMPQVSISYTVSIDGTDWPHDSHSLTVSHLTDEDVDQIQYLPSLTAVNAESCRDLPQLKALQERYPHLAVTYQVTIQDQAYPLDTVSLNLDSMDTASLADTLWHFPNLQSVILANPSGDAAPLVQLPERYPQVQFLWNKPFQDILVSSDLTEVDLSTAEITSLEDVAQLMEFFPHAETLYLGTLDMDHETVAAFREEMRSQYKVVWDVDVGYLTMRSDAIYYMPGKYNLGVTEEQAYNLRYFEDMICIDVGHKPLFSCEWAAFMPKLKYLIIADTMISDISPLEGLDQLIYLEMFITKVTDLTPLLSCTALEDLNLCYTHADPEPITQMTWLKNLWWAEPPIEETEFQEYLPDTYLMFLHHSSTGNGWRQLQNYYDMRDILGMHYMWG